MSDNVQLWEQYPDEPSEAFRAFGFYKRIPPPKRSLEAAWQQMEPKSKDGLPAKLKQWSSKFYWETRAAAWDNHLEQVSDRTIVKSIEKERLEERRKRRQTINMLLVIVGEYAVDLREIAQERRLEASEVRGFAQIVHVYSEQSRKEYRDLDLDDGATQADPLNSEGIRATIQQILSKDTDDGAAGGLPKLIQ